MKITGARKTWVLFFAASLMSLVVYAAYMRYNYYDQMVDALGLTNKEFGILNGAYGYASLFCFLPGGFLADKFKEKTLMIAGAFLYAISCAWYATLPNFTSLVIINILFGIGSNAIIWGGYIKTIRKLGKSSEQGRIFAASEFVRGTTGAIFGFMGLFIFNQLLDNQKGLSVIFFATAAIFAFIGIMIIILVPKNIIGIDEDVNVEQKKFKMKDAMLVIKNPGVWMIAGITFFCYSFTSAGGGYLGTYTTQVLGVSDNLAITLSIVRNYIIASLATLAIGFISDKIGSHIKTLGIFLAASTILAAVLILTKSMLVFSVLVSLLFATAYCSLRGIYFATLDEIKIPLFLNGVATGLVSTATYAPDAFFATLAGSWIDKYGIAGFDYIFYYSIACGIAGIILSFIAYKYIQKKNKKIA